MVLALKDTADFKIPTKNLTDTDTNFNYSTIDNINAYDRTYLDIINANRSFFFPPDKVLIERSTDSGSTWTEVTTTDFSTENRGKLFSDIETSLAIGTGNAASTQQLRITMQYPGSGWYCSLDRAFIRFSRAGHTTAVQIEASTYGAQSTYTTLVAFTTVDGWAGNNMYKFSRKTAWGTNNSGHLYNVRFTFKYTSVNSSYISSQANVKKINMYGADAWSTVGTPRYAGHLYNWDYLQNVTFPAKVTSTNFTAPRFTATGTAYPHVAGNNSSLYLGASSSWGSGYGSVVLNTSQLRPSNSCDNELDLGTTNGRWKNLYLSGTIGNGTYTYTLPSATGTLALTSDGVDNATYLIGNGRIASADIDHIYTDSKVHQRLDIASNSMTTNKPAADGYINTYMWDNSGTYDAQFYMPNGITNNSGRPQVRYRASGGTWSAWESLAKLSDSDAKVDIASINLQDQTTTLLAQVQALDAAGKDYARFRTDTDSGSAGISDKPTGNTNTGFCCTAYRVRHYSNSDYQYFLACYCRNDDNPYVAVVSHNTAEITWHRMSPGGNVFSATCSTAAATAAKAITVSADQGFVLKKGVVISVRFSYTNTAENPTFSVNGSTAKSVRYNTSTITTGSLNRAGYANRNTNYMYDGSVWVWVGWSVDDNTTYSTMSVAEGQTGTATSARSVRADYLKQIIQYYTPIVTMQTTDPGEGVALADNHFIAVYDA